MHNRPLDDTLETECRLRIHLCRSRNDRSILPDKIAKCLSELIQIGIARLEHFGR